MNERLLQYIWQFQYFNKNKLQTVTEEPLQIIHPGTFNTNQGPDFIEARIMIGETLWVGSVEIHINTSDWEKHHHSTDPNYDNVILHVVWNNDVDFYERSMPQLELKTLIPKVLLDKYDGLLHSTSFIPCSHSISNVPEIILITWKERLVLERLQRKASDIIEILDRNNYHWEETFWVMLARNFGARVNTEVFAEMASSLPITILGKHKHQIHQLEALLFGQTGLLEHRFREDYPRMLKKEYQFLRKKYGLSPVHLPVFFLRMRPRNFPTIRLAQLAMLINRSEHLFSEIREANAINEIRKKLNVTANDYWHYHYRFDEKGEFNKKKVGASMVDNIIINTIVPMLYAYGSYYQQQSAKDKALRWLEETGIEENTICKGFVELGLQNKNAWDSQALIQLKTEYCNKKRCLDCSIGNTLLKN